VLTEAPPAELASTGPGPAPVPVMRRLLLRWERDNLLRNTAFIMATTVVNGAVGYVYWIAAARVGDPAEVGVATSLIAILFLTSMATNLGMGPALIQALPRASDDRRWSCLVNVAVLAGLVSGVAGSAVALLFLPALVPAVSATLRQPVGAAMFVLGAGIFTATQYLDCAFISERRGGRMLARNVAFAFAKLLFLVAPYAVSGGVSAGSIVASFVLGSALSLAFGFVQLRGLPHTYHPTLAHARDALRALRGSLAAHHLAWFGANVPQYVLPSLVVARLSATSNAFFSMAWTVGAVFFMISPAVGGALFVEGTDGGHSLGRGTRKSALLITGALVPAMAVFLLFGTEIMGLFGPEYAGATVDLLRLLVLSAVPDAVTNVYTAVLRVQGRLRMAAVLNVGIAVLALGGTWVLLPVHGIVGAGWAWIGAQLAGCVLVAGDRLLQRRASMASSSSP
jgi:O-antigen/teichoic acid export membrane protein